MKILSVPILLFLIIIIATCDTSTETSSVTEEITIGALLPFTGTFGTQGEALLTAIKLAVEDANAELESSNKKIKLIYDDTQTDGNTAKILFNSYSNQGIRIIIGPITSAEVSAIIDTANNSNTIVISPSSTAVELALENDNVFRIIPDDTQSAENIADKIWSDGAEKLSLIYRYDTWGIALSQRVTTEFQTNGGTVFNSANYFSYRTSDFLQCLDECSESIENELQSVNAENIAVQISSYDEAVYIMQLAYEHDYTYLKQVKWYGSDGITQNKYLLDFPSAVEFAREVNFISPMFELQENGGSTELKNRLRTELGYDVNAFALLAYDALRVAAKTLADAGTDINIEDLRSEVTEHLNGYEGVTGTITLNSAGDRINGNYSYWGLNESGEPVWELKN